MNSIKCFPFGEGGIKVTFGDTISPEINEKVVLSYQGLLAMKDPEIIDMVPCYTTLTIYFDTNKTDYFLMKQKLLALWEQHELKAEDKKKEVIIIPTYYGGECGPDIERVADTNSITIDDVIKLHSGKEYLIYMMGFLPGFPYLGGLDSKLATPRLEQPRPMVEEGAVGIAGNQTGFYPIASPGGWNIIGRTPLKFFNPDSDEPFQLKMGQYVRFDPITFAEFEEIQAQVPDGSYKISRKWK